MSNSSLRNSNISDTMSSYQQDEYCFKVTSEHRDGLGNSGHNQKPTAAPNNSRDDPDMEVERAENQKFIDLGTLDLKGLSNIFDAYATKKTYATGLFNLALIATNFTQLKQIITSTATLDQLSITNSVVLASVCISLLFQLLLVVVLVILAKHGEFYDDEKREQLIKGNNLVTLLVLAISVINVFINVFLNV
jgi:hypothetical protein